MRDRELPLAFPFLTFAAPDDPWPLQTAEKLESFGVSPKIQWGKLEKSFIFVLWLSIKRI